MNLKEKVVVITGASKGFGKALAEVFLREGSKVVICSTNKKEIKSVAKKIGAFGIRADVTKEKKKKVLEKKKEESGIGVNEKKEKDQVNLATKVMKNFGK